MTDGSESSFVSGIGQTLSESNERDFRILFRKNEIMAYESLGACPGMTTEQKIDMRVKWFEYKELQKSRGQQGLRLIDFVNGYKAAVEFFKLDQKLS